MHSLGHRYRCRRSLFDLRHVETREIQSKVQPQSLGCGSTFGLLPNCIVYRVQPREARRLNG